jgi:hypothetical protein
MPSYWQCSGYFVEWQEWRDSNPQPPVLETAKAAFPVISYLCTRCQKSIASEGFFVQSISRGFR